MNKEKRNTIAEVRAVGDSRRVEGYALVFDSWSEDLGFREIIRKEALDDEILNASDVMAVLNHNPERGVLARSKRREGSLELTIDDKGLMYAFDAPHTALGDELLENLRRGEIDASSFCFTIKEDKWTRDKDGTACREILKFDRLYDVSPVYNPAYSATSVDLRGLEAMTEEENKAKAEEELRKQEEVAKSQSWEEAERLIRMV